MRVRARAVPEFRGTSAESSHSSQMRLDVNRPSEALFSRERARPLPVSIWAHYCLIAARVVSILIKPAYIGCQPGLLPCLYRCLRKRAFSDSLFSTCMHHLMGLGCFFKPEGENSDWRIGPFCSSSNNKGIIPSFVCITRLRSYL